MVVAWAVEKAAAARAAARAVAGMPAGTLEAYERTNTDRLARVECIAGWVRGTLRAPLSSRRKSADVNTGWPSHRITAGRPADSESLDSVRRGRAAAPVPRPPSGRRVCMVVILPRRRVHGTAMRGMSWEVVSVQRLAASSATRMRHGVCTKAIQRSDRAQRAVVQAARRHEARTSHSHPWWLSPVSSAPPGKTAFARPLSPLLTTLPRRTLFGTTFHHTVRYDMKKKMISDHSRETRPVSYARLASAYGGSSRPL
jgi:hypothetical protein